MRKILVIISILFVCIFISFAKEINIHTNRIEIITKIFLMSFIFSLFFQKIYLYLK